MHTQRNIKHQRALSECSQELHYTLHRLPNPHHRREISECAITLSRQECIPVGCVPAAHWPFAGVCFPGGSCPGGASGIRGGLLPAGVCCWGVWSRGVSALGGGCQLQGGLVWGVSQHALRQKPSNPPVDRCRRLWKHYLGRTSLRPVTMLEKFETNSTHTQTATNRYL